MAPPPVSSEQILRAILLRILTALFFSLMAALLKLASTAGVTAFELLFYRGLFGMAVVLAWAWAGPGLAALRPVSPLAHVARGGLGIVSMLLMLQALILLPLAEATTINFTAPVFATMLAWLVLREKVGPHRWTAVLVGFVGVAVALRPGQTSATIPLLGAALGLVSAFGQAGVAVTLRQLQRSEPVAAIAFWFMVACALVGLALLPAFGQLHDWRTLAVLAAGGICGGIAQIAMTGSLNAPVAVVMPFDYLQLVSALVLGMLLFDAWPTVNTLLGAALIAGAGLYTAWRERQRMRRPVTSAVGPG